DPALGRGEAFPQGARHQAASGAFQAAHGETLPHIRRTLLARHECITPARKEKQATAGSVQYAKCAIERNVFMSLACRTSPLAKRGRGFRSEVSPASAWQHQDNLLWSLLIANR